MSHLSAKDRLDLVLTFGLPSAAVIAALAYAAYLLFDNLF